MLELSFLKDSLHYKYYQWLAKMWDIDDFTTRTHSDEFVQFSLCKYAHFLFWFTLLTIFASPTFLIGWVYLKVARFIYKVLSWTYVGRGILHFFDNAFKFGDIVDRLSSEMEKHACMALLGSTIVFMLSLAILVILSIVIMVICGGGFWLITLIPHIPAALVACLYSLGIGGFYTCYGIGLIMHVIAIIAITIVTFIWIVLVVGVPYVLLFAVLLAVLSSIMYGIVTLFMKVKFLRDFITFRINGFKSAHKKMGEKQERKEEIREQKRYGKIPYTRWEQLWINLGKKIETFVEKVHDTVSGKIAFKVKGGFTKVVGTPSLLWNIFTSLMNDVCPFVKVVNKEEIVTLDK